MHLTINFGKTYQILVIKIDKAHNRCAHKFGLRFYLVKVPKRGGVIFLYWLVNE